MPTPFAPAARRLTGLIILILGGLASGAVDIVEAGAQVRWDAGVLRQKPEWYASAEARAVADSLIQYQSPQGAWPKNTNLTVSPRTPEDIPSPSDGRANTIDNGGTTLPLKFLALVAHATGEARYRAAFIRGIDYLLTAQYPNGGWPQFFPLREGYYSHITYNDNAMINVLTILRDVSAGHQPYDFVDEKRRAKAAAAVARGIDIILRTQVKQDGKLTAWCAQHDEKTLEPAWARAYEPPSLSGNESVGVVNFLVSIEKPTPAIIAAVEGAVAWLRSVDIKGVRLERIRGADGRTERRLVADPAASPMWARFYELGTNRPLYLDRDSVFRYDFTEVGYERRSGYDYHGTWPASLLAQDYPRWREKHNQGGGDDPRKDVEQWDIFELTLKGPAGGNPFIEVELSARFTQVSRTVQVAGFYDGDGTYKIRFMPETTGEWRYETASNRPELNGKTGVFTVSPPAKGNHGPVRVRNTFHFAYADGTPYKQLGTTAYVWTHQPDELQEQTLKTLAASPFNKIRFCVFPKRYVWNTGEPQMYPFEGRPRNFDTARPNPKFFRHFEQRIRDLQKLGIEADIILLHPYDNGAWGLDRMTPLEDDRYLRYLVARIAAFRNVWWSLANEYDFMQHKTEDDWERMGQLVSRSDPFHHLLGIHNGHLIFNQTRPWITHASMQNGAAVENTHAAGIYRDAYRKPVVYDEAKYEGNISNRWGNISAEEMVYRFWNGTVAGTYVGHGETYTSSDEILWWSKGGVLKGQSPARLAFLKQVLDVAPSEGIEPLDKWQNPEYGGKPSEYYLVYFGKQTLPNWEFRIPKPPASKVKGQPPQAGMKFTVEVLDTWNMTVTPVPGTFTLAPKDGYFFADKDGRSVTLPGRPYMALRIRRQR